MYNSVLYGLPSCVTEKLQRMQNNDRITPFFLKKSLHWLPVRDHIICKILLLTYKALNGLAPTYISEVLMEKTSVRNLRSTAKKSVVSSQFKIKYMKK